MKIEFTRLRAEATAPRYATIGDAGADITTTDVFSLAPGEQIVVGTGIAISVPEGYAAFVHPRSGLAARYGISITNAPGTIDSGYRGEVKAILINHGEDTIDFQPGDRIAQLVIQRYEHVTWIEVEALDETDRGSNGFGSTGVASV